MRADLRAVREQARSDGERVVVTSAPELSTDVMVATQRAPTPEHITIPERKPQLRTLASNGTPKGTEIDVPAPRTRSSRPLAAAAAVAVLLGVGFAGTFFVIGRKPAPHPLSPAQPMVAPPGDTPVAELTPLVPSPQTPALRDAPRASANVASPNVNAGPAGKRPRGAPQPPAPVVSASAPVASASPPPAAPPAAPAPQVPPVAEGPAIDPEKAFVEVGLVTPSGVKADAVRAAIRQAPLTQCYRNALRARATRATGSATLNLAIDESGRVNGAILTGADWLPEMTRCVQGSTMGLTLRPGSVEGPGGTAEVWLSFRMP
jgi:hypothetical protein